MLLRYYEPYRKGFEFGSFLEQLQSTFTGHAIKSYTKAFLTQSKKRMQPAKGAASKPHLRGHWITRGLEVDLDNALCVLLNMACQEYLDGKPVFSTANPANFNSLPIESVIKELQAISTHMSMSSGTESLLQALNRANTLQSNTEIDARMHKEGITSFRERAKQTQLNRINSSKVPHSGASDTCKSFSEFKEMILQQAAKKAISAAQELIGKYVPPLLEWLKTEKVPHTDCSWSNFDFLVTFERSDASDAAGYTSKEEEIRRHRRLFQGNSWSELKEGYEKRALKIDLAKQEKKSNRRNKRSSAENVLRTKEPEKKEREKDGNEDERTEERGEEMNEEEEFEESMAQIAVMQLFNRIREDLLVDHDLINWTDILLEIQKFIENTLLQPVIQNKITKDEVWGYLGQLMERVQVVLPAQSSRNDHRIQQTTPPLDVASTGFIPPDTCSRCNDKFCHHLVAVDVPGDGNCLLYSLLQHMTGEFSMSKAAEMRLRLSIEMTVHRKNYINHEWFREHHRVYCGEFADVPEQFWTSQGPDLEILYFNLIKTAATNKAWLSMIHMQALSAAFRIPIFSVFPLINKHDFRRSRTHLNVSVARKVEFTAPSVKIMWTRSFSANTDWRNFSFSPNHFVPLCEFQSQWDPIWKSINDKETGLGGVDVTWRQVARLLNTSMQVPSDVLEAYLIYLRSVFPKAKPMLPIVACSLTLRGNTIGGKHNFAQKNRVQFDDTTENVQLFHIPYPRANPNIDSGHYVVVSNSETLLNSTGEKNSKLLLYDSLRHPGKSSSTIVDKKLQQQVDKVWGEGTQLVLGNCPQQFDVTSCGLAAALQVKSLLTHSPNPFQTLDPYQLRCYLLDLIEYDFNEQNGNPFCCTGIQHDRLFTVENGKTTAEGKATTEGEVSTDSKITSESKVSIGGKVSMEERKVTEEVKMSAPVSLIEEAAPSIASNPAWDEDEEQQLQEHMSDDDSNDEELIARDEGGGNKAAQGYTRKAIRQDFPNYLVGKQFAKFSIERVLRTANGRKEHVSHDRSSRYNHSNVVNGVIVPHDDDLRLFAHYIAALNSRSKTEYSIIYVKGMKSGDKRLNSINSKKRTATKGVVIIADILPFKEGSNMCSKIGISTTGFISLDSVRIICEAKFDPKSSDDNMILPKEIQDELSRNNFKPSSGKQTSSRSTKSLEAPAAYSYLPESILQRRVNPDNFEYEYLVAWVSRTPKESWVGRAKLIMDSNEAKTLVHQYDQRAEAANLGRQRRVATASARNDYIQRKDGNSDEKKLSEASSSSKTPRKRSLQKDLTKAVASLDGDSNKRAKMAIDDPIVEAMQQAEAGGKKNTKRGRKELSTDTSTEAQHANKLIKKTNAGTVDQGSQQIEKIKNDHPSKRSIEELSGESNIEGLKKRIRKVKVNKNAQ
jgi:hypothetical protein